MANVVNRNDFGEQMHNDISAIARMKYMKHEAQYTQIVETRSSSQSFERTVGETTLKIAQPKAEGAPVVFDSKHETYAVEFHHITYSLAFAITEEMLEDGKYGNKLEAAGKEMGDAFQLRKEIECASILNEATTRVLGDGKTLFATNHPTFDGSGSTWSNTPGNMDLSEAALEQVDISMRHAVSDTNIPVSLRPECLIIPPALVYTASRILKSQLRSYADGYNTQPNDINALRDMGTIPSTKTNIYLTNNKSWFVKSNAPGATILYQRVGFTTRRDRQFETGNFMMSARERFSQGVMDPRGFWGSMGS